MNPLLDFTGLPRFADFKPEHVAPAIDQLLSEARAAMHHAAAPETALHWDSFVAPLEDANERLSRAWGQVAHLHAVMDSPPLREAYNANLPKITQYYTELGQNEALFAKYRQLRAAPGFEQLENRDALVQQSDDTGRAAIHEALLGRVQIENRVIV